MSRQRWPGRYEALLYEANGDLKWCPCRPVKVTTKFAMMIQVRIWPPHFEQRHTLDFIRVRGVSPAARAALEAACAAARLEAEAAA